MLEVILEGRKHLFGELDASNEALKRCAETLESMWSSGQMRMTQRDIDRAKRMYAEVSVSIRKARAALESFKGIASRQELSTVNSDNGVQKS